MLLDAQLAEFKQHLYDLAAQVDTSLDLRIQNQQIYISSVQQTQFWLTVCLLSVSFLLIVLGAKAILTPVSKLERVITAISRQENTLPMISTSGPKELIILEQKLHILAGRLIQSENLRHALLRHASHELKTPLASIKKGCSLLTEQVVGTLNAEQHEVLSLLNSSTDRLNLLIVQLLDYNLLLQQAKPSFSNINTASFFEAFVNENSLAINQNNNLIEMQIELPTILADLKLYRRILDNLVSNAIAHGSKGSPIYIRLYQQENMQILDFANRGQKIETEQRHALFQPFSRGEGRRIDRVIGSGLGLSIVADCTRMMFGKAEMVEVDYAEVCIRVQIPNKEIEYMKSKLFIVFSRLILFTSCELLQSLKISQTMTEALKNPPICVWKNDVKTNECKIEYWIRFWYEIEDVSWPERKKQIDALSEQDTDVLRKVLLSQGKSTPFQDRLRAQAWVESILPKLSLQMHRFIIVALYHTSQDLLEMESALVSLSKMNTHQSLHIEEQQILLNEQQSQIDQLLNIETSIIQSIEEDKQ